MCLTVIFIKLCSLGLRQFISFDTVHQQMIDRCAGHTGKAFLKRVTRKHLNVNVPIRTMSELKSSLVQQPQGVPHPAVKPAASGPA